MPSTAFPTTVVYQSDLSTIQTVTTTNADGSTSTQSVSESSLNSGRVSPNVLQNSGAFTTTMSGGAATLDLTALTGLTIGNQAFTVNGNTQKPFIAKFFAPKSNTNPVTIQAGAGNGNNFNAVGWKQVLNPGQEVSVFGSSASQPVDSTHKTWDISGTGADQLITKIIFA